MSTISEEVKEKVKEVEVNTSSKGVLGFINDSYHEVTKEVTWTKTNELYSSTTLVLVASLIFALVIGGIDFLFKGGLDIFYKYIVK
jgi:preprotein translocase subunit SecE